MRPAFPDTKIRKENYKKKLKANILPEHRDKKLFLIFTQGHA